MNPMTQYALKRIR
uniref:Uncharacterized protein n=1 Tax=Rhizophora mucronata TaxID=61149 RepID=A0A2P2N1V0_RHIMU